MARAARMPMMTTTIMSSTSVKPRLRRFLIIAIWTFLGRMAPRTRGASPSRLDPKQVLGQLLPERTFPEQPKENAYLRWCGAVSRCGKPCGEVRDITDENGHSSAAAGPTNGSVRPAGDAAQIPLPRAGARANCALAPYSGLHALHDLVRCRGPGHGFGRWLRTALADVPR